MILIGGFAGLGQSILTGRGRAVVIVILDRGDPFIEDDDFPVVLGGFHCWRRLSGYILVVRLHRKYGPAFVFFFAGLLIIANRCRGSGHDRCCIGTGRG